MDGRSRFLAACRNEPVDSTPVWFMRQAGGLLPGYLALRERHSVLEIARSPGLCAEVSTDAAATLGTDAAVLFADVMLPVEAMGMRLDLTAAGPILEQPLRTRADLERLRAVEADADLGFVLEAIGLVRRALGERAAVIGVAGGPFTLAAYMVEGGPSRDQLAARRLMHADPRLWSDLLEALTSTAVDYVRAQAGAGADAIQLFDSWAGSLAPDDYAAHVAPWSNRILRAIREAGAVAIHFVAAGSGLLEHVAEEATVIAIDSAQPLDGARRRLGAQPVQGNLDPARVAAGWRAASHGVDDVLRANAGQTGHIFNTGHAIPRDTPPSLLRDVVAAVHERTAGRTVATIAGGIA